MSRENLIKDDQSVPSMLLTWNDIVVTLEQKSKKMKGNYEELQDEEKSKKKKILSDVFGAAYPGEVIAILGPSGAGKTTLLNVLAQRNCGDVEVHGSVKINGLRATRDYMKRVSAYVQQDDLFIGSLTVEEHLRFMARLKMGSTVGWEQQQQIVKDVIRELGLTDSANSIIGTRTRKGISGGEKKRLAFASEVLTSPPILICDEPTSGLDAFLSFQVISILKKLAADKGMTVILTIHQPSSQVFHLFDRVYIMSQGHVAFTGTQKEAEQMWKSLEIPLPKNFNPSDHYLASLSLRKEQDKHCRLQIKKICDAFRHSEVGHRIRKEAQNHGILSTGSSESSSMNWKFRNLGEDRKYAAGFFQQISALSWRASKTVIREPLLLKVQLMQSIVIALLTGLIYVGTPINQATVMTINGNLYQMITNMAFMFQFSVVHHFCFEMNTFFRENSAGLYRVSTYFIAKNLAELPSYIISSVVFTSILYWMSGLYPSLDAFGIYVLVGLLVQNIAISIGYMFSCIFGTVQLAVAVMPIFVVPMMAFGGFFINQATLPAYFVPLKFLSYFGYAYETLTVNEWRNIEDIPGCERNSTCPSTGQEIVENLGFSMGNSYKNLIIMVIMIFVFRFVAFLALLIRARSRK